MQTALLPLMLALGDTPMVLTVTDVWMSRHPTTSTRVEIAVITRNRSDATLTFDWDFGDEMRASTTLASTTHRYVTPDTYFLTVVVTDSHNHLTAKVIRLITVASPH